MNYLFIFMIILSCSDNTENVVKGEKVALEHIIIRSNLETSLNLLIAYPGEEMKEYELSTKNNFQVKLKTSKKEPTVIVKDKGRICGKYLLSQKVATQIVRCEKDIITGLTVSGSLYDGPEKTLPTNDEYYRSNLESSRCYRNLSHEQKKNGTIKVLRNKAFEATYKFLLHRKDLKRFPRLSGIDKRPGKLKRDSFQLLSFPISKEVELGKKVKCLIVEYIAKNNDALITTDSDVFYVAPSSFSQYFERSLHLKTFLPDLVATIPIGKKYYQSYDLSYLPATEPDLVKQAQTLVEQYDLHLLISDDRELFDVAITIFF